MEPTHISMPTWGHPNLVDRNAPVVLQPEMFNILAILEGGLPNLVRLADEGGAAGYFLPDPSVEPYVSLQEKLHGMLYMPHLSMAAAC